jgi:hypothetical protein
MPAHAGIQYAAAVVLIFLKSRNTVATLLVKVTLFLPL